MGDGYTTPCHPGPPAYPHCPVPLPSLWREGNRGSTKRKFLYAQVSLELAACWAIVNGTLASSVVHCHPNSFLSGVYYVNVTEESGDIFFQDPRQGATVSLCPVTEFTPWTVRQ